MPLSLPLSCCQDQNPRQGDAAICHAKITLPHRSLAEKAEVVANCDHLQNLKFSKTLPLAFTEHGAIQAANVLNSAQAVELGIFVVRAFVQMREMLSKNKELAAQLDELDKRIQRKFETHDRAITGLIEAIRKMMAPEVAKKRPIGFVQTDE